MISFCRNLEEAVRAGAFCEICTTARVFPITVPPLLWAGRRHPQPACHSSAGCRGR